MSVETDVETGEDVATDSDADALAAELGEAIAELPSYRRFIEAKAAVEADEETQERISEFEQLREQFAFARQMGNADEESMRKLQQAQADLHSLPLMEEYVEAQDALQGRLSDLNEAISDPLTVDFGGEAGGCCQD